MQEKLDKKQSNSSNGRLFLIKKGFPFFFLYPFILKYELHKQCLTYFNIQAMWLFNVVYLVQLIEQPILRIPNSTFPNFRCCKVFSFFVCKEL